MSADPGLRGRLARYPLVVFFVLAFVLTWAVWIPRALGVPVGAVGQLWTWMPAIAALLAAALTGGRRAVRQLGRRLGRWRVPWLWYVVVLAGPAAFSAAVAGIAVLAGIPWSSAAPEAFAIGLPSVALLLVVLCLTDGLGEEPAWRGYALPRLLRHSPLVASLVLGLLWGLWHLPLLWTETSTVYRTPVWLFGLDIVAKSVLFTWVFLHTRGSALLAVLLHGSTNLFAVSPPLAVTGGLAVPMLAAGLKWVLVILLLGIAGARLARRPDPEALPTAEEALPDDSR
jgi:membrane protease YdiL (CAAX protease family)